MVRRVAVLYAQNDLPTARGVISSVLVVNIATALPIALLILLFFPSVFAWTRLDNVYRSTPSTLRFLYVAVLSSGRLVPRGNPPTQHFNAMT